MEKRTLKEVAQADAEWQKERRAAWVAFVAGGLAGEWHDPSHIAEWADEQLAEFDKRFGEGK